MNRLCTNHTVFYIQSGMSVRFVLFCFLESLDPVDTNSKNPMVLDDNWNTCNLSE